MSLDASLYAHCFVATFSSFHILLLFPLFTRPNVFYLLEMPIKKRTPTVPCKHLKNVKTLRCLKLDFKHFLKYL